VVTKGKGANISAAKAGDHIFGREIARGPRDAIRPHAREPQAESVAAPVIRL